VSGVAGALAPRTARSGPPAGGLLFMLCRELQATRVVDCTGGSSATASLAAAVRANGGGTVIVADASQTLRTLEAPVDFVFFGRPEAGRSFARDAIEILAPHLRPGGLAANEAPDAGYLRYVRDPGNGFISWSLESGCELSYRLI